MIKLSNQETLIISGRQFVLTGEYKVIGNVTDSTIAVQCPMSNQVFIIKLWESKSHNNTALRTIGR